MRIQNPRIRSCANPQLFKWLFQFFSCQIFLVHFLKIHISSIFSKVNQKNWQLKDLNCHLNCWTISLLVMRRFLNYTKFHCLFNDRKCTKLWQPAPSLWGGGVKATFRQCLKKHVFFWFFPSVTQWQSDLVNQRIRDSVTQWLSD